MLIFCTIHKTELNSLGGATKRKRLSGKQDKRKDLSSWSNNFYAYTSHNLIDKTYKNYPTRQDKCIKASKKYERQ